MSDPIPVTEDDAVEVSVVLPCLNEARTLEGCVRAAQDAFARLGVDGEVLVADNGSTDGSQEIARGLGARVVDVPLRGYGAAITGGCRAAKGRYLLVADADMSYDLGEMGPLLDELRAGRDLVLGSRFKGTIQPGAMPWKNRVIGNPALTGALRVLFRARHISDAHSGFRGLTREAFDKLNLRTPGMEFASEMIVRACRLGLSIGEVPITLRPDQRGRAPHLRPWRDGWRHLKFMLMFAPGALFLLPGLAMMIVGIVLLGAQVFAPADEPLRVGGLRFDFHWAIFGGLLCVVGYQVVNTYLIARIYSVTHDLRIDDRSLTRAFRYATLERALLFGALGLLAGVGVVAFVVVDWVRGGLGPLVAGDTRLLVLGSTFVALGVQTISNAFIFSILGDRYQRDRAVP
jgi:glycosyltransferase involved in cell wall biosynthesis